MTAVLTATTLSATAEAKPLEKDTLEDILDGAGELAALPQLVMRVIDMTADPKATPADLERGFCASSRSY